MILRSADVQHRLMGRCLELAGQATPSGDVPVGALVTDPDGEVLGEDTTPASATGTLSGTQR